MTLMLKEIQEEPASLYACEKNNSETLKALAAEMKQREIDNVILSARGSSDNAGNYFKYLFEVTCGIPVGFAAPAVTTVYGGTVRMGKRTMVLGVSQSGKAADVLEVIRSANSQGALTVAITNNTESPLAKEAQVHLFCSTGEEKSVAATKTFIAQMFLLARICQAYSGNEELCSALTRLPEDIKKVLSSEAAVAKAAERYLDAADCYVLGRGYSYGIAQEIALKIMETTYTKAKAFAASDFHHGPFAVIDSTARVILAAPSDAAVKDLQEMFHKVKAAGADVTVFTDRPELFEGADAFVSFPTVSAYTMPFLEAVCAQLFAQALSTARGLNPDQPRGLNKITVTK